ncbi:MAG: FHA domain-containing protein [Myxococcota bacterium]
MEQAELLAQFSERVDQFDKYQSFIAKAQEQSGKFAAAVVQKVVADNESKSMEVVSELIPLMTDIEAVIEDLRRQRAEALDSSKESQFKLEELELRLAIGDLDDDKFQAEANEFKSVVDRTESLVADLDGQREQFESALSRWQELGTSAGVLANGASEPPPMAATPAPAEYSNGGGYDDGVSHQDSDFGLLPEPGYDDGGDAGMLEAHDGGGYDHGGNHVDMGGYDDGMGGDGFEVSELDLADPAGSPAHDLGLSDADKDKPRRAVLLYQEGTADEQIYPFTNEIMSLGRGRDNDVQVKNDSKVSRYHCKLYRRGPNFYIEDNKSANGTLVNGELITERRLFGGEEVIIGETFFRFRILD